MDLSSLNSLFGKNSNYNFDGMLSDTSNLLTSIGMLLDKKNQFSVPNNNKGIWDNAANTFKNNSQNFLNFLNQKQNEVGPQQHNINILQNRNNQKSYDMYDFTNTNEPLQGGFNSSYLNYNAPSQNEVMDNAKNEMLGIVQQNNANNKKGFNLGNIQTKISDWMGKSVGKGGFQTTNGNRVQGIINTVVDFGTDLAKNIKKDYSSWNTQDMINDAIGGGVGDDPLARAFTGKSRSKAAATELGNRIKYEGTGGMQGANVESSAWDNHQYSNLAMNRTSFGKGFAQYNVDTLNYAKKGFDIGGPWGALIGGIVGSASSLLGHIGEKNRITRLREAEDKANRKATAMHSNALNVANQRNQLNNLRTMANMAAFGGSLLGLKRKDNMYNYYDNGGYLDTTDINQVVSIDNGGTHEENPLGGVPYGKDNQGKQNLVEEGEQIWTNKQGQEFVFSNRIAVPEDIIKKYKLKGNTFAECVSGLRKKFGDLKDTISQRFINNVLNNLKEAQEQVKANNGLPNNATGYQMFDDGGVINNSYDNELIRYYGSLNSPDLYYRILNEYNPSLYTEFLRNYDGSEFDKNKIWGALDDDKKQAFVSYLVSNKDNINHFNTLSQKDKEKIAEEIINLKRWKRNNKLAQDALNTGNATMLFKQFMNIQRKNPNYRYQEIPEQYAMAQPNYTSGFTPTFQRYTPQNSNLYNAQLQNDLLSNLNALAMSGSNSQTAANISANLGRMATDRANAMANIYQTNSQQRNSVDSFNAQQLQALENALSSQFQTNSNIYQHKYQALNNHNQARQNIDDEIFTIKNNSYSNLANNLQNIADRFFKREKEWRQGLIDGVDYNSEDYPVQKRFGFINTGQQSYGTAKENSKQNQQNTNQEFSDVDNSLWELNVNSNPHWYTNEKGEVNQQMKDLILNDIDRKRKYIKGLN